MYVCLCNGIRESELKDLARDGVRDPETAYKKLDCEPMCHSCLDEVEMVLRDEAIMKEGKHPSYRKAKPKLKLVS